MSLIGSIENKVGFSAPANRRPPISHSFANLRTLGQPADGAESGQHERPQFRVQLTE